MRTIAVVNQKGGCGKTTTAINLAAVFAARGLRTLLVDVDPQSHCAAGLGVPEKGIDRSIGDAMLAVGHNGVDRSRLMWQAAKNLDLAPSTMRLAALEAPGGGLHELPDKDRRLQAVLEAVAGHYDRCLIDCPPTIGLLTFNAMRAAREALIPVETGYFALQGAQKQWETIQRVIRRIGRPIACHLLPTLHDPHSALARDILAVLRRRFAGQITPVVIREHEELREAASMGQAVIEYAPHSDARRDHEMLADWLEAQRIEPAIEIEILSTPGELPRRPPTGSAGPAAPRPATQETGSNAAMPPVDGDAQGGRAAELVERLRKLMLQDSEHERSEPAEAETKPPAAPSPVIAEPPARPVHAGPPAGSAATTVAPAIPVESNSAVETAADDERRDKLAHFYGVACTSRGVLFVQPTISGRTIYVGGDFNHFSPTAHHHRRNPQHGVDEALVRIPPGRHHYRLLIDGHWQVDPYNGEQEIDEHGELASIVDVPEGKMES